MFGGALGKSAVQDEHRHCTAPEPEQVCSKLLPPVSTGRFVQTGRSRTDDPPENIQSHFTRPPVYTGTGRIKNRPPEFRSSSQKGGEEKTESSAVQ